MSNIEINLKEIKEKQSNEYNVYYINAELFENYFLFLDELDTSEKGRIKNIKSEYKKAQFLFTRIFLKKFIKEQYGFKNIEISQSTLGKPIIKNVDKINISIAHKEGVIFIGVSTNHIIGVDCEYINYKLFKQEYECLIWTMKESLFKALGIGFKYGINSFNVEMQNKKFNYMFSKKLEEYLKNTKIKTIEFEWFKKEDYIFTLCYLSK